MKTSSTLHPWVTTSACYILNPPEAFSSKAFRVAKKVALIGLKGLFRLLALAFVWGLLWVLWAFAAMEPVSGN